MLIDEVLAHEAFPKLLHRFHALEALRTAHAFVMTEDAQRAAAHLIATSKTATPITDQFRLPYPVCWVEGTVENGKVGFYLDGRFDPPPRAMLLICISRRQNEMGIKAMGAFEPDTLRFSEGGRTIAISCSPIDEMHNAGINAREVLNSAIINAMSAIAIINSPAVSSTESSDLVRLNRQRAKRGKPPLLDHHIVHIRPAVARQLRTEMAADDEAEGRRLHWRRGHFKARKTGLFWWSPHLAGRKELGMVEKDYVA